jgi:hypothetical protein
MVCVVPKVPPNYYATTFPATEANVSEGGRWLVGDNSGANATTGPQTTGGTPGVAYTHAADGTDYLAVYQGSAPTIDSASQYVELTIKRTGGYVAPSTQEDEGLLFFTLAAGVSSGYEFDIWFGGSQLQTVRWNNGATGSYDFTAVTVVAGEDPNLWPGNLVDGDVVRIEAKVVGGNPKFWAYVNGTLVNVFQDTTAGKITSGQPGFGFFTRDLAPPDGYDAKGFALRGVKVGTAA